MQTKKAAFVGVFHQGKKDLVCLVGGKHQQGRKGIERRDIIREI
jgi:hypothetical protein